VLEPDDEPLLLLEELPLDDDDELPPEEDALPDDEPLLDEASPTVASFATPLS
jgi:hypothetical protein